MFLWINVHGIEQKPDIKIKTNYNQFWLKFSYKK